MRRLAPMLLTAALVLPPVAAAQGTSPAPFPTDSAVRAILRQRVEEKRSAGIVVGLLDADGSTRYAAYGDAGPGQPPLDASTVFEIGSITKVFTATVLSQMVQEGKVRLDDPAQRYLPASVHLPTRNGKEITLLSLSEQNSGLPYMPSNMHPADKANPFADYTVPLMYEFLTGYTLPRDPGAQFEYSNIGVGLLGHILSLVDGKPYEQMVRDRIWAPLGMTSTAITLTPEMRAHLALGHDPRGEVVPNWDLDAMAGAGAIRSTARDLLRFADANLHAERGPLQRAMAFAQVPRASAGAMRIGLNWMTITPGTDTITWHNGGTGGYRTFLGLQRSPHRAVVVLTNTGGVGADDIGLHLLVPAVPLAPAPQPMKARTAIALSAADLAAYVGTYQLAPTFEIAVTQESDALFLQATNQPKLRLWAEAPNEFFLKEVDAQISFVRDAGGRVTGLVLHQNGMNQPGPRVR